MRLATVLTPTSDDNLQLAAQCGVTDLVYRYPGPSLDDVLAAKRRAADFDLNLSVIEGFLPIERLKLGTDDGADLMLMKQLIRHMGEAEIPVLCYNFMAGTDWVRTKLDVPERGGALVTAFDLKDAEEAILLGHDCVESEYQRSGESVSAAALWEQLERLLAELVPVAETAGVKLAMHPDDPPLPQFQGKARIMNSVDSFERLVGLANSAHNSICFCQGSFAAMGADIPDAIRRLGPHISYVHFRDVVGGPESFRETFHDNGPTDMAGAIRELRNAGVSGPIRPDHVPQLVGEQEGEPGYTMQGRLFAYGYIRGLLQATDR